VLFIPMLFVVIERLFARERRVPARTEPEVV
jgi:hypothetical protein